MFQGIDISPQDFSDKYNIKVNCLSAILPNHHSFSLLSQKLRISSYRACGRHEALRNVSQYWLRECYINYGNNGALPPFVSYVLSKKPTTGSKNDMKIW